MEFAAGVSQPLGESVERCVSRRFGSLAMVEISTSTSSLGTTNLGPSAAFFDNRGTGDERGFIRPDTAPKRRFLPGLAVTLSVLDFVFMCGLSAAFIFMIRDRLGLSSVAGTESVVASISLSSMVFAYATGCYRHDAFIDFSTATTRLAVGLGVCVLLLVPFIHFGLGLLFHGPAFRSISRGSTIVLIGVGVGLCGGMLSRSVFLAAIRRQWLRRTIMIIGTGRHASHLRDILADTSHRLYFLPESYLGGTPPTGIPDKKVDTLAGTPSASELVAKLHVDQIVLAVDDPREIRVDRLLPWKANGIPVVDFNTFLERETGRIDITWTDPNWLLYSDGFRFGHFDRALKRLLDLGISICLLLTTLPGLLMVALAILLDDFGPVFYRQQRVSYGGRPFWIFKFRTMRVDAEKNGAQWASESDPRITRLGRILRRTRIDEIPQLINVLRGDMSLVGPRPERPVFVDDLSTRIWLYHLRHSVKAGLTGWAQINYPYGASVEDAKHKLEYDLYYLKHFSVLRDIAIMLQTLRVLLFAKGGR
jgi:sugar transferase (PEP-CTERM system associated)